MIEIAVCYFVGFMLMETFKDMVRMAIWLWRERPQ